MEGIINELFSNIISGVRVIDIIDIAIVAFVLYKVLVFIQETRAEQIIKGLLILLFATKFSEILKLYTLNWILKNTMTLGVIAIIIVFQPEMRRALEYIGRGRFVAKAFASIDDRKAAEIIDAIVGSCLHFSKKHTGALIIFEKRTGMADIIETGTKLNADISEQILLNLFTENAALHDGAVIVRGDKIAAAGCVLPLSQNKDLDKELGTRHRAGIGITENSDAVSLIISEETGVISVAVDGKLSRFLNEELLRELLTQIYKSEKKEEKKVFKYFKNKWGGKND